MWNMFTFTYHAPTSLGREHVVFVYASRDRESADEAFAEVIGVDPEEVRGLTVEVKRVR